MIDFNFLLPCLEFMTGEVVLVSPPIAQFGGQISPDDSILVEWQLEHSYVRHQSV